VRTLLRGGSVYSPADPHATAIAVDDGVVSWIGDDTGAGSYADGADEVVDLAGRLVTPAFVDAHLHTVQLGFMLSGLDLSRSASLAECLDAIAAYAGRTPAGEVIVGQSWDDSRWPESRPPTAAELDRAAPGRSI
jgi:predicted amidohydrolase YtcJ